MRPTLCRRLRRESFFPLFPAGAAATAVGTVIASESASATELPAEAAAALDQTDAEFTQYYGRYRRPRPRRQVCTVRRNRFGRPERICRWVY